MYEQLVISHLPRKSYLEEFVFTDVLLIIDEAEKTNFIALVILSH